MDNPHSDAVHPLPDDVALNPNTIIGGSSTSCSVALNETVVADTQVHLSTDRPNLFSTFPPTATVLAGNSDTTPVTVTTKAVSQSVTPTIFGTLNGGTASASLTINPAGQPHQAPPPTQEGGPTVTHEATLTEEMYDDGTVIISQTDTVIVTGDEGETAGS